MPAIVATDLTPAGARPSPSRAAENGSEALFDLDQLAPAAKPDPRQHDMATTEGATVAIAVAWPGLPRPSATVPVTVPPPGAQPVAVDHRGVNPPAGDGAKGPPQGDSRKLAPSPADNSARQRLRTDVSGQAGLSALVASTTALPPAAAEVVGADGQAARPATFGVGPSPLDAAPVGHTVAMPDPSPVQPAPDQARPEAPPSAELGQRRPVSPSPVSDPPAPNSAPSATASDRQDAPGARSSEMMQPDAVATVSMPISDQRAAAPVAPAFPVSLRHQRFAATLNPTEVSDTPPASPSPVRPPEAPKAIQPPAAVSTAPGRATASALAPPPAAGAVSPRERDLKPLEANPATAELAETTRDPAPQRRANDTSRQLPFTEARQPAAAPADLVGAFSSASDTPANPPAALDHSAAAAHKPTSAPAPATPVLPHLQLAHAVAVTQHDRIELTLSPEELGRVRLHLHHGSDGLLVQIAADRPETLDLIRRHLDEFGRELRGHGHDAVSFSFSGNPDQQRQPQPTRFEPVSDLLTPAPAPAAIPATRTRHDTGLDLRL